MHKLVDGRTAPGPGQTYAMTFVPGMPGAVQPFSTATRSWNSATCRSKSRAMRRCRSSFTQWIQSPGKRSPGSFSGPAHISTRLRRWSPLHRRQSARPRYFDARTASLRAPAPAEAVCHGFAFLRGGMTASASRSAMASWHFRVSQVPSVARKRFACKP